MYTRARIHSFEAFFEINLTYDKYTDRAYTYTRTYLAAENST